ncbi:MAG TPA: DinB family protein, partial [Candidatus Dormibacteraeota bacterium]|nr:DinB family protein [Candidatus Dormibacteraeota bacterium]
MGPFEKAMRAYALLDDAALDATWSWRGGTLQLRDALYRSLGDELDALVVARARWERDPATTDAERILALADRAMGGLRGLLVGQDDALLDRVPAPGEWTLRETLRHMLDVERRYATNTSHAVHRRDDE